MDDTLIVEVKNEVCHISSKSGRFDQTCPAEYNAMLKQLALTGFCERNSMRCWFKYKEQVGPR
jgi:hypothetical protein